MFQKILRLCHITAGVFLLCSDIFAADPSEHSAEEGTHHFLTLWHDWVLLALVLALIALLVINYYRVKSQRALRESEARFKALAERSVVGISLVQDGVYKFVNPRLAEMFGYSKGELEEKRGPLDFVHPDDKDRVERSMARRIMGEEEFAHYEARMVNKDSETRFVEVFGSRMIYRGSPAVIATLLDITDRKKTQQELARTHSDLRQILDSAAPLLVINRNFDIVRVNDTFCAHVGLRTDEVLRNKCYDVWSSEMCHTPNCPLELIKGGVNRTSYEKAHVSAGGVSTILAATALPYLDVDGSVQGMIASFSDITELKDREKALRHSEEKSRAQFVSIPVATYIWQKIENDFVLVDYNDEAMKITGGVISSFVGKTLSETFPDREDWRREMLRCLESRTTVRLEKAMPYYYRATGETKQLMVSYAYVPPDFVMIHTVDITDRINAELALKESESRFRELAEKAPVGIYLVRGNKVIYVNQTAERIVGYTMKEIVKSENPLEFVHPDDRQAIMERLAMFASNELSETRYEVRVLTGGGGVKHLEIFASPILYMGIPTLIGTVLDITERKEAERALRESEDRFKALAEKSPVGVYMMDEKGFYYVNEKLQEIMGYSSDELLSMADMFCFIHPDDQDMAREELRTFMTGPDVTGSIVFRVVTKRGDVRDLEIHASKLYLSGKLAQVGSVLDVTERKKSEQALKESEDRFKTLAEQSPVGIYVFKDGHFAYTNPRVAEIMGYTPEELRNMDDIYEACYPDDRSMVFDWMRRFDESDEESTSLEYRGIASDRSVRHVEIYVSKVMYEGGPSHMGTLVDVSERVKSKEALLESERKFRALAETTNAAIVIYNEDGYVYHNPAAEAITELTHEELSAMTPWEISRPDYHELLKDLAIRRLSGETGLQKSYELPVLTKSGKEKWCLYSAESIQYGGKPAVLGTAVDITERRLAEAELRQAQQERYDQVKQVAGGVAHEIYNALFPAAASIDKLKGRVGNGDDDGERNTKLLDLAETSVERAIQMTELVTQFSRLESNADIETLELANIFDEILRDRTRLEILDVALRVEVPKNIKIDMNRLHAHSLFTNLINNALDALEEVDTRGLTITATGMSTGVRVDISDTGSGIPADILPKLFSPFFSTKPRTGTGLGLAICRRITDIYGAKIIVDSALDRGTTFTVFFKHSIIGLS